MSKKEPSKNEPSRAAILRALLTENPRISAKEAEAKLVEKGIEFSPSAFYSVRSKTNKKRQPTPVQVEQVQPHEDETSVEVLRAENEKLKACIQALIATLL